MNLGSSYYFNNHLAWQIEPVTQTVYVFDNKNGESYLFEGISKDIWKMIYDKRPLKDMLELLVRRYDVSNEKLKADISEFINELLGDDLIYEIL